MCCAGIAIEKQVESAALSDWRAQFDVNVYGIMTAVRAALQHLRAAGGSVVTISSTFGVVARAQTSLPIVRRKGLSSRSLRRWRSTTRRAGSE